MVDYNGLENRRAERHRGFESLSLRKAGVTQVAPVCIMREVDENPGSSSRSAFGERIPLPPCLGERREKKRRARVAKCDASSFILPLYFRRRMM